MAARRGRACTVRPQRSAACHPPPLVPRTPPSGQRHPATPSACPPYPAPPRLTPCPGFLLRETSRAAHHRCQRRPAAPLLAPEHGGVDGAPRGARRRRTRHRHARRRRAACRTRVRACAAPRARQLWRLYARTARCPSVATTLTPHPTPWRPLQVWVNGRSASSSEVLAGALHDNCRASVVGSRSFGKGLIQGVFGLSDGGALVTTVASYATPSGREINLQGAPTGSDASWQRQSCPPVARGALAPAHGGPLGSSAGLRPFASPPLVQPCSLPEAPPDALLSPFSLTSRHV